MTIPATASQVPYAGDGVTVAFPITFIFDTPADIKVVLTSTAGAPTELSTGFAITGGNGSTGTCTMVTPPAIGEILTVLDDPERSQTAEYPDNDAFPAETHERALDRVTRLVKRLHQRVDRSIRVDDGDLSDGDDLIMPISSTRAGLFLAFDVDGNPLVSAGTGGGDAALRTDLASTVVSTDGSRLIGFRRTEAGSASRSLFEKLADTVDVRDFGAACDGVTDDAAAWTAAVAAATRIRFRGTSLISSMIVVRDNVTIEGDGIDDSEILASANTFSLFGDNNVSKSRVTFRDMTFNGGSIGATNRGAFFDADTASQSTRIRFHRCHFKNLFRGAHLHRVDGLEFYDCTAEDLSSSVLYVGLSVAAGRSRKVRVRGIELEDIDTAGDAAGTGVIFMGYADIATIENCEFVDCGASSGLTTHHHSIYVRDVTDMKIRNITSIGQLRGAGVQVFSDLGMGEALSKRVSISNVKVSGTTHYAGVRVDQVATLTLSDVQCEECYSQACYISNVTNLTATNVTGRNNNRQGISGTDNAMWWLEAIAGGSFVGCIALDDVTTGVGVYGQGTSFAIHGACADLHWTACNHKFGGHSGSRYYGIEVVTAATLTGFSVHGFTTDGASASFHETGTATLGAFDGVEMRNANVADLLSIDQLHKFRCRAVIIGGSPWRFESNGVNLIEWRTNFPSSGNYLRDDRVIRSAHAASATPGWWCTADNVASNGGTWKAEANLAA